MDGPKARVFHLIHLPKWLRRFSSGLGRMAQVRKNHLEARVHPTARAMCRPCIIAPRAGGTLPIEQLLRPPATPASSTISPLQTEVRLTLMSPLVFRFV